MTQTRWAVTAIAVAAVVLIAALVYLIFLGNQVTIPFAPVGR